MVELREITNDNFNDCVNLKVAEAQKDFVYSNCYSLAQAWVNNKTMFPFAIYADACLVGFLMLAYITHKDFYKVSRLMIDERYQRNGYGKAALQLGIEYLVQTHGASEVFLSVASENTVAARLYECAGFEQVEVMSGNKILMRLHVDT